MFLLTGVNLIVKEMTETADDIFATEDAIISVTVKPKIWYGSSATNWANDIYKDRLDFPEEHEIDGAGQ